MLRFQSACRTEGRTEIAFVASGTNLQLTFNCNMMPYGHERECDFEKEQGKVSKNQIFSCNIFWICWSFISEDKKVVTFASTPIQFNSYCYVHTISQTASHYVNAFKKNSDELRMISICTSLK